MSECIKCGVKFVGTAANPPGDGLCWVCQRDKLKEQNEKLRKALEAVVGASSRAELEKMKATVLFRSLRM